MAKWPVKLQVKYKRTRLFISCELKRNYFLVMMCVLLIIVKVCLEGQVDGQNHMLVQGASLAQLANGILVKKEKKPDFILIAIYFDYESIFHCYLIYKD